ncbi:MAG: phage portal protein, partial [Planctomycetota bacterium]
DYRRLDAYVIRSMRDGTGVERTSARPGLSGLLGRRATSNRGETARTTHEVLEVLSAGHRQVYIDARLVEDAHNPLGVLPVVHVQNGSQPFHYAGLSDVEPLIPLQDELNTRLSDRAHRVTLQSFNMYLAKGLDGDGGGVLPVAPGQIWTTNNPDASIQAFGGDGYSPSEDKHIEDVRESMDKVSSVSPVVLGVVRAKLGHLSSANALRITLLGVLSRMERRRQAYGRAIARLSELVLQAMDVHGVMRTVTADRGVRVQWADPLPVTEEERLRSAQIKRDLGVPEEPVLEELGYGEDESDVN